jgi:phage terminase large subunit-like protein
VTGLLAEQLAKPPQVETAPAYRHSDGPLAAEFVASDFGVELDDWEAYALERMLGRRQVDGGWRWASLENGLVVPRQNGKGAILEARALYGLFVVGERLITWTAHEDQTAREAFYRVVDLIGGDEHPKVKRVFYGNQERSIKLHSGQRLIFRTRTGGSGRGFSGDCVMFDEAFALSDEQLSALFSTLSARPDPQIYYASMAGRASSVVLRRIRDRGIAGDDWLSYLEWGAADNVDLDDREVWRRVNPAEPHRITEEFIEAERATLSDEDFARERLCMWNPRQRQAPIPADVWFGLGDERSRPHDPVAFALDVPPEHDAASIAVAGPNAAGGVHVELVEYHAGTSWAPRRQAELAARWSPCGIALDAAGPAGSLLEPLKQALAELGVDIEVDLVSGRRMAAACGAFYQRVRDGSLSHLGQPDLAVAVDAGRWRKMGDASVWHRRDTSSDISPLVAATEACYTLDRHGWQRPEPPRSTTVKRLR